MTAAPQERSLLVGDIGGTNVRLARGACAPDGAVVLSGVRAYPGDDFPALEDAVRLYLEETGGAAPDALCLSVAGPVEGDTMRLTNRDWVIGADSMAEAAGARRARLVNDFAAAALSLPFLPDDAFKPLGGPPRPAGLWSRRDLRVSALGPGTGLGHAVLVCGAEGFRALDTEGGHISYAATDEEGWAVVKAVAARFGRCSLEHVASGPGLSHLYHALSGEPADGPLIAPKDVRNRAEHGDEAARRAETLMCEILGAAAGDFALATGARDAVFILGGVGAALADVLASGGFREKFEAKGSFAGYVGAIPTELVVSGYSGLIGAAAALVPGAASITVISNLN